METGESPRAQRQSAKDAPSHRCAYCQPARQGGRLPRREINGLDPCQCGISRCRFHYESRAIFPVRSRPRQSAHRVWAWRWPTPCLISFESAAATPGVFPGTNRSERGRGDWKQWPSLRPSVLRERRASLTTNHECARCQIFLVSRNQLSLSNWYSPAGLSIPPLAWNSTTWTAVP